jgi:ubiquitin-conjugating enzyme E2 variant
MHGAHHKSPFEGNYCIVSGLWNPLLDDSRFFRRLEDFFYATTKVEPRCWYPPEADWAEQETPKA